MSVHVYSRTGSASAASALLLATTAPAVLLGGIAGGIADRFDRRWILVLGSVTRVPIVAALALTELGHPAGGGRDGLPVVFLLVALDAVARQVFIPAEQGLLTEVAGDDLAVATAANSAGTNITRLIAPAAGGALYAAAGFEVTVWSITAALLLAAMLLAVLGWMLPARRDPERRKDQVSLPTSRRPRPGDGLWLLWSNRHLRAVSVLYAVDGAKEGVLSSLFAGYMISVVGAGAGWIGLTNGVFAIGALCAAPLIPVMVKRWGYRWPIAVGASVSAAALLPMLLVPSQGTALLGFALAGLPFTVSWVAAGTLLLLAAPEGRRSGAVGSSGAVWAAAMLAGAAVAGPLGDGLGLSSVLLVVTVVHLMAGPFFLLVCPKVGPATAPLLT